MKVLTSGYKYLAKIECYCCREDHTILLTRDTENNEIWFDFKDAEYGFSLRNKNRKHFKSNYEQYLSGNRITSYGILIQRHTLLELRDVLKQEKVYEDTEYQTLPFVISHDNEPHNKNQILKDQVFFKENGLILYQDYPAENGMKDTFTLGYYLTEQDSLKAHLKSKTFYTGNNTIYLSQKDICKLMWVIKRLEE